MMTYRNLLLWPALAGFLSCSDKPPQKPEAPPDTSEVSTSAGKKSVLASFRQNYLKEQADSLTRLWSGLPAGSVAQTYQKSLTSTDRVTRILSSAGYKEFPRIYLTSGTGTGLRTIYFRAEQGSEDGKYPVGSVLICENRDPGTERVLTYEVMVKTSAGWEFLLFDHGLNPITDAIWYRYPQDCISCHYGPGNQDPYYRFAQYLNQPNPITRQEIRYDGFIPAHRLSDLTEVQKQDGVFGPYLFLKSASAASR